MADLCDFVNLDFIIENTPISKIQRSGRKPTSEEYEIGNKIYNEFKVGNCSFFPSTIKYKSILSRLDRLNKKNETDYEYTVRRDTKLGEVIDVAFDIELKVVSKVREVIEGFRIYRVK